MSYFEAKRIPGGYGAGGFTDPPPKKKRKPRSDLQTIKTMFKRAGVEFTEGACLEYDDEDKADSVGVFLIVGHGRHTAEFNFTLRGKLVDVEGGGY